MLAFERKLEVSDALMYAGDWEQLGQEGENKEKEWEKIPIIPRQNRSTQSTYSTTEENKTKPNPVSADNDDANLPHDKDTLKVSFTLRVIGNVGEPFACNDPDFEKAIKQKVDTFKEEGLRELSFRYAHNIASGRFLWRNRVCADKVEVHVKVEPSVKDEPSDNDNPLVFNGYHFPLNDFSAKRDNARLQQLAEAILRGLNGNNDFVLLSVDAYVRLGKGQHVFPSQEMNVGEKKKVLFQLDGCAALHNVKIGNAIRSIDDWYDSAEFPIAVEPYGSVTHRGEAYRRSRTDLFTLT